MPGFVLDPQGGAEYGFHGSRVLIKASGKDTLGQLTVLESVYPPGLSVHVHVHDGEDEMFYVTAGELAGTCGEESWTARPGSFVFVPRDTPHSLRVTSTEPAVALVITGPPRLDQQIVARAEPVPDIT
ncbi:MAG: cupin domain-containing protein [Nocardiopsaceae bacterium]|jgi:quercetin dioxygenase-like cupin family protein|nr:cupin domain-containing protein [Nocardiopsaceae bacterium]